MVESLNYHHQQHTEDIRHDQQRCYDELPRHSSKKNYRNQPYYLALFNDDGTLQNSSSEKIFKVEVGSVIRFHLRRGGPMSKDVRLLVNLPRQVQNQGSRDNDEEEKQTYIQTEDEGSACRIEYTVTQPRSRIIKKLPERSSLILLDKLDTPVDTQGSPVNRTLTFPGSKLDTEYLEDIPPTDGDRTVNLEFIVGFPHAGSFFVQLDYFDQEISGRNYSDPIYINVEPHLNLNGSTIRCKELRILTVIPRCLGTIEDRWEGMYENISQLGYNAIHFAPIQKYGLSRSHYSIADQTVIDDHFFKQQLDCHDKLKILKSNVDRFKEKYGVVGIVDIVLNHTANNSEWIKEHPDAGYNTQNCPHLNSAWVLDKALVDFSGEYASKRISECPSAPYVNNEQDLTTVINAIQNRVINKLNLHEFFMFNIERTLIQVREVIKKELVNVRTLKQWEKIYDECKLWGKDQQTLINEMFSKGHGVERNEVKLDLPGAAAYFYLTYGTNEEQCIAKLKALLFKHNEEWKARIQGYMKDMLENFRGEIRYHKIELDNKCISSHNLLLRRYFTELNNDDRSKLVNNGWIMNAKPMEDFAMEGWHYLKRDINIWGDSIKLRFGECPEDSPYLWEHMSRYVADMAMVFDGFRLDNAHSTPMHVCNYLLQVARSVNPNLFVMAELFTSSSVADALFVRKLNINGLIREMQNSNSAKELGDYFHRITCKEAVLGLVDEDYVNVKDCTKYEILKSRLPNDILYDTTHDNPTYLQKFRTGRLALPFIGVASMADIAIASTWGTDQLLPKNICVVKENRLYEYYDQTHLFTVDGKQPPTKSFSQQQSPEKTPEQQQPKPKPKNEIDYEFKYKSKDARQISVAGSFNNWQKGIYLLNKVDHENWSLQLTLPIISGSDKYEFKFILNENDWKINESIPKTDDGKGNINNYLSTTIQAQPQQTVAPVSVGSNRELTFDDIRYARLQLNEIHNESTRNNAQIFLHQQAQEVLVVIRQFDLDYNNDYDAYTCITRHCFYQEGGDYNYQTIVDLPGQLSGVMFAGYLEMDPAQDYKVFYNDQQNIKGARSKMRVFKGLDQFCRIENNAGKSKLVFFKMPPSFTCVVKTKQTQEMKEAVRQLNYLQKDTQLCQRLFPPSTPLSALNHLLFRCEVEEKEISSGTRGTYGLEKYGLMRYAGIASLMTLLRDIKLSGDMGHELFENMRKGDWYLDYARDRLKFMGTELQPVIQYLDEYYSHVKKLDKPLRPKYGSRVIEQLYNAAVHHLVHDKMKDLFLKHNSDDMFIQRLALAVVQMYGRVPSAEFYNHKDTMCAGLPHFSTGYTRCWGRDTFISLKGLFIATGLWQEAEDTIVFFARVLRHGGLIPNLHDRGSNTRYNARDATWFFTQAIRDYYFARCEADGHSKNAEAFLRQKVDMHFRDQHDQRFHHEKLSRGEPPQQLSIIQIIHQILQSHASGIKFREWNAGTKIDENMKSEGFNIDIYLDRQTGFIHGGNQHNCGTWMDKMGSSDKNRGVPATPRDGAPIEIVAMLHSTLRFMDDMKDLGVCEHEGVELQGGQEKWSYCQWADKIQENFEKCFWVPKDPKDYRGFEIDPKLVNRQGIYKDVYRPSQPYTAYQLRPNLCVAMSYAPELFNKDHARECLGNVERILTESNCMGIKTLDTSDRNYNGDYINSDDTCGFNYHQGPEWLWPVGFFLKAKALFDLYRYKEEMRDDLMRFLIPHQKNIIHESYWEGLPELTNSHGKECKDSCSTQAWSIATVLDAVREFNLVPQ